MSNASRLEVENLRTEFVTRRGVVKAVNDVSFSVAAGETVGLVGESGCGKSATVRSMIGLIRPPGRVVAGQVRLGDRELVGMRPRALRRIRGAEIGFVGQSPFGALNPVLTIERQFANVVLAHRKASRSAIRNHALLALRDVGIAGPERVLDGYAHELSGGMAQRVVIAMAMALDPSVLIADEPTTALDVTVQRQILDLITKLVRSHDRMLLLVTHDLGVVAQYCDRVVVMYAGKVVEQGPVRQVITAPAHPYTDALLRAVPRAGRPLQSLPGRVPDLVDYPVGCPYRSRCERAVERCAEQMPEPDLVAPDHTVRCFVPLHAEIDDHAATER